ncbi:MAG: SDR family oxidoreductase [bacterium]|jgi:3-oxoacyl-[acyl-carrier protein] reductase
MELGLSNKVAFVTGASAGIGFAAAMELAREGTRLAINSRSPENIGRAAGLIQSATGSSPLALPGDISHEGVPETLVAHIREKLGAVEILVVNAGGPPPGLFISHSRESWLDAADLTLFSAINLCRAVVPDMIRKKWGRLIFITSIAVKQPVDNLVLSNTLRAGVTGLAKSLSNELARYGITSNTVCPGYTETERLRSLAQNEAQKEGKSIEDILKIYRERVPAGRLGRPDELAALVAFLASDRAAYISGSSITVDGGLYKGLL